jgi:CDP-6-deoxy-D-xylo-4-hexulose-3-dehydrase
MKPLACSTWGPEERAAAHAVIDGDEFTMGRRVAEFEAAYADYCGTKYCVACNSGSSANLLMVAAYTLRHGPGKVIVPAVGWATSYSPFAQYGWKLIFVDIDRETLNYDLAALWDATMSHEDVVILAINLLGNPNEFDSFPRKAQVLEDNCESMGAQYGGRRTGSFGVMASHSTFFSHHICTMEGGMVTTDDEEYYHMLLSLRSHGWTRHLPEKNRLWAKPDKFTFILPGYNVRPTEIQAAIGLEQLKKLPGFIHQRRENASRFPLATQREIGQSSWYGFAVFEDDMSRVAGRYETRPVVTGNFLRQPTISHYDYEVWGKPKNADWLHDRACMIGNNHLVADWSDLTERAAA